MDKIGILETTESLVYKRHEVIRIHEGVFAGADAFQYPNNQSDLRGIECLSIPSEWRWIEKYEADFEPDYGPPKKPGVKKYEVVKGPRARDVLLGIVKRHETGALVLHDATYPYAIPINHAYANGNLYLHCGKIGKKLGLIRQNPYASYLIYAPSSPLPQNARVCHSPYESVTLYGKIRISADPEEKETAIRELTDQYGTPHQHGFADMIEILVFEIDHATARNGRFKPSAKREIFYVDFKKAPDA